MSRPKLQYLLVARAGEPAAVIDAAAQRFAEELRTKLPTNTRLRAARRVTSDQAGQSAHAAENSGAVTAFEAVSDIWPDDETPVDRLIPLIGNLTAADAHWIDAERSAALVGTEHIIMPGEAPILVVFALRRLRTLTPEAFCDYWLNKHAEFGRRPGNRYRQFHVDQAQSAKAAEAAGLAVTDFDGVAEASFADLAELQAVLASPEVAQGALADERRFIDHANSIFAICRAV